MVAIDPNALFARAENAFRGGHTDAARADLHQILRAIGDHAAVLHLLALVESRAGRIEESRRAFVRAVRAAPQDVQVRNNYGNLLDRIGEAEAALAQYGAALAAVPGFIEARLNRAGVLARLGRDDDALADLDGLLAAQPAHAAALVARGSIHLRRDALAAALADFDAALAVEPRHPRALIGRGRVTMEAGAEAAAIPFYRAALAVRPGDRDAIMGLADAMEAAGEDGALPLLVQALEDDPSWIEGQDSLARMRSEAGQADDFDAGYRAAMARHPDDAALAFAHVGALARASRHADALRRLDEIVARIGRGDHGDLYEAVLASESGDLDRADAAFSRLPASAAAQFARGRHLLRRQDPAAAAALLEPLARADLGAVNMWAHLGIAWRLLGDPGDAWLNQQPGLVAVHQLGLSDGDLATLADVLRGLHRSRAHPIGQSLRGGTQTRGRLFGRPEPAIAALADAVRGAITAHVAALPPADPHHPLLRHRAAPLTFAGSWSIRLTDGGFHVSHVHPAGVLSSACYIVVPDLTGGDHPGWLEIGVPPVELGLDLPPLQRVEPCPGRLVLFPSTMFHGTRPFPAGERLTVAFDIRA